MRGPRCATKHLAGAKTNWRLGCEGKYACKDCVKMGRPCFTFAQIKDEGSWTMHEFRLLPMHEQDRLKKPVAGQSEVRYWLNVETAFKKDDVIKDDEDDEDYVD